MKTSNCFDLFENLKKIIIVRGNYLFALFPFFKMGIKVDFIYIKLFLYRMCFIFNDDF